LRADAAAQRINSAAFTSKLWPVIMRARSEQKKNLYSMVISLEPRKLVGDQLETSGGQRAGAAPWPGLWVDRASGPETYWGCPDDPTTMF
jgi:hypothetical protein